jgi:hypothetical protein
MSSKKIPTPTTISRGGKTVQDKPAPARMAVSPEDLKELFGPQTIPLADDFASLIDMADMGSRAVGLASDQDGNAGAGFMLEAGLLNINNGNGLVISSNQLTAQANVAKGIVVETAGIGVNAGNGLVVNTSQLTAQANATKGIVVETAGIGVNVGIGLQAVSNQIRATPNAAKGIVVETAGIGVNVGIGLQAMTNQIRAMPNAIKGIVVETAGIGLAEDAWQFILARSYNASLIATSTVFTAFAVAYAASRWYVHIQPRGGSIPYASTQYPALINNSSVTTVTGYPSYRASPMAGEILLTLLNYTGTIVAGTIVALPQMEAGGTASAYLNATFRAI